MELIFLFGFVLAAIAGLASKKFNVIGGAAIIASLGSLVGAGAIAKKVAEKGTYVPSSLFSIDSLGAIVLLIIATVGLAATIYSTTYLKRELAKKIIGFTRVRKYFMLLNMFLAVMFLAVASSSPIFTWICIEATTLSTAFLISFYDKPSAMEAAWKYLIVNSIGLLLAFFGTLLYFTIAHTISVDGFITWQTLLANASHLDPQIAKVAFVFILIGYGTKAGLVPMHTWLPDAHSKAPSPISALLSGVLLNVALFSILRFRVITDAIAGPAFSQHLLMAFGLVSIVFAAIIIFNQSHYKRMLAYSSIENMGIIVLGFAFGGLGAFAGVLHMIYHSLIKSSLFLVSGNMLIKYSSGHIKKVRGVLTAMPITGALFTIGILAIAGIPPFGTFLTEFFTFSAGAKDHLVVVIIAVLAIVVLFIGLLKNANSMIFGDKPDDIHSGEDNAWLIIPPVLLLGLMLVLSFYLPPFLQTLIRDAAARY